MSSAGRGLTAETVAEGIKKMQYALRGAIVTKAQEIETRQAEKPDAFKNFSKVIYANIGNPQRTGQPPLTYLRLLSAMVLHPPLINQSNEFPSDLRSRAKKWVKALGSIGCYSHSKGTPLFREEIAQWFTERDGYPADPEAIFLTDGASSACKMLIELMIRSSKDGILIPVPEYPLYSATIIKQGGRCIPYYLDESAGWALTPSELTNAVSRARAEGINVRALVVINPGNPTGAVMPKACLEKVIEFCEKEGIFLIADEVYQQNIYAEGAEFVSMRKIAKDKHSPIQLASLHSASKGIVGECGLRGGLMHLENVSQETLAIIYKLASVSLCSNLVGQAVMTASVTPPKKGEDSYDLFTQEFGKIFYALRRKAALATKYLNSTKGLSCVPISGALYAYPKLELPEGAIAFAAAKDIKPDMLFALEFLEEYGVVVVPGSGFGQKEGTWHVRMTILPSEQDFEGVLQNFASFYKAFCQKYENIENIPEPLSPVKTTAAEEDRETAAGVDSD